MPDPSINAKNDPNVPKTNPITNSGTFRFFFPSWYKNNISSENKPITIPKLKYVETFHSIMFN
ncbi:MAG: hypothetical protein ACTSQP_19005 [Promethearchaeota archaeon]